MPEDRLVVKGATQYCISDTRSRGHLAELYFVVHGRGQLLLPTTTRGPYYVRMRTISKIRPSLKYSHSSETPALSVVEVVGMVRTYNLTHNNPITYFVGCAGAGR